MPLPLVPIVIAAAVVGGGAGGFGALRSKMKKRRKQRTLAILGGQNVGKTTLLEFLKNNDLPRRTQSTSGLAPGGEFELSLPDESTALFQVAHDLPGYQVPGYKRWEKSFNAADDVWYLFRADQIACGDPLETRLVDEHLDYIRDWYILKSDGKKPKVLLVGVYSDMRIDSMTMGEFENRVREADVIRTGSMGLGSADIVFGNLASEDGAKKLVRRISSYL